MTTDKKRFFMVLVAIIGAFFAGLYVAGGDSTDMVLFVANMGLIAAMVCMLALFVFFLYVMIKGVK